MARIRSSTKIQFFIPQPPASDSDPDIIEVYHVWDDLGVPSCNPEDGITCGAHRANLKCCEATSSQSIIVSEVLAYFENTTRNKTHLMPCYTNIKAARLERDRRIEKYNLSTVEIARITMSSKSYVINTTHLELLKTIADGKASPHEVCLVKSGLDDSMLFLWGDIHPKMVTDGWDDLTLPAPLKEVPKHPLKAPKRVVTSLDVFDAEVMSAIEWQPDPGLRDFMQRFEKNHVGKDKGNEGSGKEQA